jgi:hypothetical protein
MAAVAISSLQFRYLLLQLVNHPHHFVVEQAGQPRLAVEDGKGGSHVALTDGTGVQTPSLRDVPA